MNTVVKTFAGFLSERWREPSKCEACGAEFVCGATLAGCWCTEIKLSDETRAELRARYSTCLCRKCLENAAALENGET
jgi:hypothetical protein